MSEIKPCPHCGKQDSVILLEEYPKEITTGEKHWVDMCDGKPAVACRVHNNICEALSCGIYFVKREWCVNKSDTGVTKND